MSGPSVSLGGRTSATAWFTAPDSATTLTFRLRVTDPRGASDTDSVTVRVRRPAVESLGAITGSVSRNGTWRRRQRSTHRSGNYSRFYSFTLSRRSRVTIDLSSSTDPYLYLLRGAGTSGSVIESDDDGGSGTNSRIVHTLPAGTYTIEATTYSSGRRGRFTLSIQISDPDSGSGSGSDGGSRNGSDSGSGSDSDSGGGDSDSGDSDSSSGSDSGGNDSDSGDSGSGSGSDDSGDSGSGSGNPADRDLDPLASRPSGKGSYPRPAPPHPADR